MSSQFDDYEIIGPQGERTLFIGDLFEQDVRAVCVEIMTPLAPGNNLQSVYNLRETTEPLYVREVCLAAARLWSTYVMAEGNISLMPIYTKGFTRFSMLCRALDITAPTRGGERNESP
ncbi:hypothetical protein [Plantibacter sp. YIM 135249]|uniref:hypothetical protein n=1 Tax=Plantibacter sp. YIM 135249 TaxID=3423918 RepID=UPI003D350EAC